MKKEIVTVASIEKPNRGYDNRKGFGDGSIARAASKWIYLRIQDDRTRFSEIKRKDLFKHLRRDLSRDSESVSGLFRVLCQMGAFSRKQNGVYLLNKKYYNAHKDFLFKDYELFDKVIDVLYKIPLMLYGYMNKELEEHRVKNPKDTMRVAINFTLKKISNDKEKK